MSFFLKIRESLKAKPFLGPPFGFRIWNINFIYVPTPFWATRRHFSPKFDQNGRRGVKKELDDLQFSPIMS